MSLQDIFTDEQIVTLQRAPLDVAALAAEADMELEEVELEELSIQLNTYDHNPLVKELFISAKELLDSGFEYSIHDSRSNLSNINNILSSPKNTFKFKFLKYSNFSIFLIFILKTAFKLELYSKSVFKSSNIKEPLLNTFF